MKTGTIRWHRAGYGLITPIERRHDVVFEDKVVQGTNPQSLQAGDQVNYETDDASNPNLATKVMRV